MEDRKLGCRSVLVLMKLGFDLRASYGDLVAEELPPRLKALCDELMGYASFEDVAADD